MEEKNKHSLKKAIDNLPKYTPGDQLWDKLSNNLDGANADDVLHQALQKMTVYEAPDHIWDNIEAQLPRTRKMIWLRPLAVGATIALLIGLAWTGYQNNFENEVVAIEHVEKEVKSTRFIRYNNSVSAQRDSAFRTIVRAQKKSDDAAKLKILAEIELLDESKKRLKSKLSPYDVNKDLEEKLNRMEAESEELQQAYLAII